MNIKDFVSGIYYVGVNDRVTSKFEGLWPLPNGVSYNSYFVKGSDKNALIDTVRIDELREFLEKINVISSGRKIDYLIINHMEPDHSGSIPQVLLAYPDMKIVGNSKTIEMIKGFYHIDNNDRFLEVKDGDEINLGDKTLKFILTPMVHWPETMMTYIPERKLIFSGDAFGTFGALNGDIIDTEMDTDMYISEMYRYYSNIVGKYGRFVQNAISKVSSYAIEYICPTHGPVWHDRIAEVTGITDSLSKYESEEGAVIIYGSMYGNTAEVAEKIAQELSARGLRKIIVHNASTSSMSQMISDAFRYRILIVGSATYSMRIFPPVEEFMNAMETREIKNKIFATFSGYTWAKGPVTTKLTEYAERMKLNVVDSVVMQHSIDNPTVKAAEELARKVMDIAKSNE